MALYTFTAFAEHTAGLCTTGIGAFTRWPCKICRARNLPALRTVLKVCVSFLRMHSYNTYIIYERASARASAR